MALFQSKVARGKATPPTGYVSGARMTAVFTHTFDAAFTAASDKLELGLLPAGAQLLRAELISGALGAITADVGLMSGEAGTPDGARTVGNEILNDASVNGTAVSATTAACIAIAPDEGNRGIGVTLSGNVVAGANKTLTLVIDYTH